MPRTPLIAAALLALAASAFAQYKVIGADGSVTYTDRPPANSNAKVTALGHEQDAPSGGPALPFALRQTASRYPVTLYAAADCPPCDAARQYLQQRGIPYSERRIVTEEDGAALQRIVGGRTVPSLMIGSQALRGLSQSEWASYLDAAGYPQQSALPPDWKTPAPTPLVAKETPRLAAAPPAAPPPPPAEEAPASDTGIRF